VGTHTIERSEMTYLGQAESLAEAVYMALAVLPENKTQDEMKRVGEELISWLYSEPRLGLATTYELLRELNARAVVAKSLGEEWPDYRTIGGENDGG
jgi:hypothetical protein